MMNRYIFVSLMLVFHPIKAPWDIIQQSCNWTWKDVWIGLEEATVRLHIHLSQMAPYFLQNALLLIPTDPGQKWGHCRGNRVLFGTQTQWAERSTVFSSFVSVRRVLNNIHDWVSHYLPPFVPAQVILSINRECRTVQKMILPDIITGLNKLISTPAIFKYI